MFPQGALGSAWGQRDTANILCSRSLCHTSILLYDTLCCSGTGGFFYKNQNVVPDFENGCLIYSDFYCVFTKYILHHFHFLELFLYFLFEREKRCHLKASLFHFPISGIVTSINLLFTSSPISSSRFPITRQ